VSTLAVAEADPFLWLEDIEGQRALAWVQQQNTSSLQRLMGDARYEQSYQQALGILEDRSRIPYGALRGGLVYNYWQDDQHVRGLWRRTALASYATAAPQWEHCWTWMRWPGRKGATGSTRAWIASPRMVRAA